MRRSLPLALFLLGLGCATTPITGRQQLVLIGADEEKKMGADAYKETLAKAKLSTDARATAMIERVGKRIAAVAERPDFEWEFHLIEEDKTVNAWCLPGGKVAFYTGILPVTKTETGVAVVMGHEIGHAIARHGAERMSTGMLAGIGAKILAVATQNRSPEAQEAFQKAYGTGASVGVMLPFSRKNEAEADRIGLILMAKAGYDPREAVEFWKRMAAAAGDPNSPLKKLLSTHPSNDDRIANLRALLPEALSFYKP